MNDNRMESRLTSRLIDSLYVEAMLLADEARAYFDENGRDDRDALPPIIRVGFSCESLKVTTRLMHVIAWLLTRRAIANGELDETQGRQSSRKLGHAASSDTVLVTQLPGTAQSLIQSSLDLFNRVKRIDDGMHMAAQHHSPAHNLQNRIRAAL